MWDSATAERNTFAILPSLPKIDAIWCQGGTDGVLKAFITAKRTPLPPTGGADENRFRRFMTSDRYMGQHVDGLSMGQPLYLVLVSLELARRILNKTYPRKDITIPFPYVTNETVKVGENVFLGLPDSFFDSFTDSGPDAIVEICVDAALNGAPCPGTLDVRLPKA
jgi:ribose transport system substrate-binding protein